jgi:hypothetical protein
VQYNDLNFCPLRWLKNLREALYNSYRSTGQYYRNLKGGIMSRQSDTDNHSNQLNPNNDAYWESRGYDERPDDWEDRAEEEAGNQKGFYPILYMQ